MFAKKYAQISFKLIVAFSSFFSIICSQAFGSEKGLPLYFWKMPTMINFGDYLSVELVERIVGEKIRIWRKVPKVQGNKLLAIGSIFYFASDNDVVWGSGINGKTLRKSDYSFKQLDVRAVRGPLTRQFLMDHFNVKCPEVYGDPALLMPYLFPELKRKKYPAYNYIVIPHYSELHLLPKREYDNVVYPTEPWDVVVDKILNSQFVISSSLHGIVVAEAFGIPARMLRISSNEYMFKYHDYYSGTGRPDFEYATSIEEALMMGGERPVQCDLQALYDSFPFDLWPDHKFPTFQFSPPLCLNK